LKLSKTSWLILSAGIFLVVVAGLCLTRSQQLQEQGQLGEELSIAERRLSKFQISELQQQQEELQRQLDESTVHLTAAKDILSQTVESIGVTDEFFQIAQFCDVAVMNISSSGTESGKFEGIACTVITLNAMVEGEVPNLIDFVIMLNTDFTNGVVKSAQIDIPSG